MVLRYTDAYAHIRQTTDMDDPDIPARQIADQAGEFLMAMHKWHFAQHRSALLDLRGRITGTTATWTESSKTLTQVGAFTNYTHVEGDKLQAVAGTGVDTDAFVEVVSKTDSDNIVLGATIASPAVDLATGDIEWDLPLNSVALPSDFQAINTIHPTDSVVSDVREVGLAEILRNRTSQREADGNWDFRVATAYAGDPPVPILEVWPNPSTNQTGAWSMFYTKRWVRGTSDTSRLDLPEMSDIEALYIQIVRAFARGYSEEDEGSLDQRLEVIVNGPIFRAAKRQDGMSQSTMGQMRGGAARSRGRTTFGTIVNRVADPS